MKTKLTLCYSKKQIANSAFLKLVLIFLTIHLCAITAMQAQTGGPNFKWAKGFGGKQDDMYTGSQVDTHGNIYICGTYTDTVDFNPDTKCTRIIKEAKNKKTS